MTTTYVLGAGASLHSGYPLASTMGAALLDFMLAYPIPPYPDTAQFLIDTFGKSPNIEDVITALQSRTDELKSAATAEAKAERTRLGNCLGFVNASVREWFREIHTNPSPDYAAFAAKVVKPGDVIITFNYDDSLERELRRVGKWDLSLGYGFSLGKENTPSDVLVLKLHGSMNWLVSLFGGLTGGMMQVGGWPPTSMGDSPVIHKADLEFLGYSQFSGDVYPGGGAFPCLILPGRKKQFFFGTSFGNEFGDFWDSLWTQAAKAVKRSEKIVFCGYSLLPVDQRARDLFLKVPERTTEITVVCGSQSERIANDFKAAGLRHVETFAGGHFEDWVNLR